MARELSILSEHQSLYGVGLVLASYPAATAAGGDGFLGAFAAGLAVVMLNQSLCDCFLEYGEVTSEMAMLLAFVLFGVVLSGFLETVDIVPTLGLAAAVVFAIRPAVLGGSFGQGSDELAGPRLRELVRAKGSQLVAVGPAGGPGGDTRF